LRDLVYGCRREDARLTERKLFRRSRARFCSRGEISRARPRPVTEFLNSWTKSISREGSDAVTYLPRLYFAQEAAREENVAKEEGIISRLTEQGETLPPRRSGVNEKAWISSLVPPSPTTTAAPPSLILGSLFLPLFFSILFLLRSAKPPQPEKHSAPSLHGSALLLVFSFRPFYPPRVGPRACNIPRYVRQNNRLGKRNERTSRASATSAGEGEGETCENEITRLDRNVSRE
ncbi:hypothetical protein DBV15_02993, partial [Temnothorax longispinosus]